ncbi:MAG TPA: hypothetical protein VF427_08200 [Noviherbaspirillum sp.]
MSYRKRVAGLHALAAPQMKVDRRKRTSNRNSPALKAIVGGTGGVALLRETENDEKTDSVAFG